MTDQQQARIDARNGVLRVRANVLIDRLKHYRDMGCVTVNIDQVLRALDIDRKGLPEEYFPSTHYGTVADYIRNAMPASHPNSLANNVRYNNPLYNGILR